ncbi:VOC family protein [Nocardia neocaledoniensis NBRC 108232]|uniref:Putative 3-demethylubiquinone-9 3-methyltransferase (Glyoxalase superfamily) n=1 Tax=Nocardia neocaledoniensis TaxID=236511 RepID=A0A317NV86_9NOCA|nr:VOC family protein [Nocardia neocaledoniensis]PWV79250.1 putative 3-demethylubiquinone-9 3-methyltransferase (glyoxalase superfamily) [Nocardia neocaledoniensis]GEM30691.1 VOC family protein [Nocardia neocaledoniensis NBRC 108232]
MTVSTFLWFDTDAEAAGELYAATVPNSRVVEITRQGDGSAFVVSLDLDGHAVTLMNGGPGHPHTDAASLQITVDTQDEIDALWDALTADGGEPGPCGWLTDRFGVSWQVVPAELPKLLAGETERVIAVGTALRAMSKLDIAALRRAHDQA